MASSRLIEATYNFSNRRFLLWSRAASPYPIISRHFCNRFRSRSTSPRRPTWSMLLHLSLTDYRGCRSADGPSPGDRRWLNVEQIMIVNRGSRGRTKIGARVAPNDLRGAVSHEGDIMALASHYFFIIDFRFRMLRRYANAAAWRWWGLFATNSRVVVTRNTSYCMAPRICSAGELEVS